MTTTITMQTATTTNDPHAVLRRRLAAFAAENKLSNSKLGKLIGYTAGPVSKFIRGKYEGDETKMAAATADMLKAKEAERALQTNIFETSVTTSIFAATNLARQTAEISLVHGPAGCGKSKALELYRRHYPTAVLATLTDRRRDGKGFLAALFEAIETRTYKNNLSRWNWLVDRLAGSSRPLLIDNAQRLDRSGVAAICDFQDQTGLPISLAGNPEVVDVFRSNDTFFSRLGPVTETDLGKEEIPAAALEVARQFVPWADEIADLIAIVASHKGRLRAVKKQCLFALALQENGIKDPAAAFRAAHKKLIRNYALPA